MRPLLHPTLVNGRTGDPALYIETLFETPTILFDLGDISPLPPRKIQRLGHVFVSHAHIDHFIGFDRLLRVLVGRTPELEIETLADRAIRETIKNQSVIIGRAEVGAWCNV